MCTHGNCRDQKRALSPLEAIADGHKLLCGCWQPNPGPLAKQQCSLLLNQHHNFYILSLASLLSLLRFHESPEMGWNYFSQTYFVECLIFKNFHFIFLSFYLCGHVHVWRSDTILPVLAFHDGSPGVNSGYQTWQQVLSSETSH